MATSSRYASDQIIKNAAPDAFAASEQGQQPDEMRLPGQDLLDESASLAGEMMTGAIPQDVQDVTEQKAAERGLSAGLGQGQAGDYLVARDLGLTSLEISMQGSQLANQTAQAQGSFNALVHEKQKWDDQFLLGLREMQIKGQSVALAGYELISKNQQFATEMAVQLAIENSRKEIEGVQQNIDSIIGSDEELGYFYPNNEAILDLITQYV